MITRPPHPTEAVATTTCLELQPQPLGSAPCPSVGRRWIVCLPFICRGEFAIYNPIRIYVLAKKDVAVLPTSGAGQNGDRVGQDGVGELLAEVAEREPADAKGGSFLEHNSNPLFIQPRAAGFHQTVFEGGEEPSPRHPILKYISHTDYMGGGAYELSIAKTNLYLRKVYQFAQPSTCCNPGRLYSMTCCRRKVRFPRHPLSPSGGLYPAASASKSATRTCASTP